MGSRLSFAVSNVLICGLGVSVCFSEKSLFTIYFFIARFFQLEKKNRKHHIFSSTHHICKKPKFKTKFAYSPLKQSPRLIQCCHLISVKTNFATNFFHRTTSWKIIETAIARLFKLNLLSEYWSTNFGEEQKFLPLEWNLQERSIRATLCFPTIPRKYIWTAIFLQIANTLPA